MLSYIVLSLLSGAAWAGETPLTAAEINKFGITVDHDASGAFSLSGKSVKQKCFDRLQVVVDKVDGGNLKLNLSYVATGRQSATMTACTKDVGAAAAPASRGITLSVPSGKSDISTVSLNGGTATNLTTKIAKAEVKKVPVAKDKVKLSFKGDKLIATVETTEDCKDDIAFSTMIQDGAKEYKKDDGLKALEAVADKIIVDVTAPESCSGKAVTKEIEVRSISKNDIALAALAGDEGTTPSPSFTKASELADRVNCGTCEVDEDKTEKLAKLLKDAGIDAPELDEMSASILKKASQESADAFSEEYRDLMASLAINDGQDPAARLENRRKLMKRYKDLIADMKKAVKKERLSLDDMETIIGNPNEFPMEFLASVDALEGLTQRQLNTAYRLRRDAFATARGLPFLDESSVADLKIPNDVTERQWIAKRDAGMTNIETFMYKGEVQTYVANAQKYLEACQKNLPAVAKNPTAQGMAYAYECNQAAAKLPEYQNTLAELEQRQQAVLGNLMGTAGNTAGSTLGNTKFISSNGGSVSALGLTAQGTSVNGLQGYSAMGFNNPSTANVQSAYNPGALQTQFQQQGTSGAAINFLSNGNGQRI